MVQKSTGLKTVIKPSKGFFDHRPVPFGTIYYVINKIEKSNTVNLFNVSV